MTGPVLVLGGGGFLGAYIVEALVEAGCAVRVLDRSTPRYTALPAGVPFTQADWQDGDALSAALRGVHTVLHLIWSTVPGSSARSPLNDLDHNVGGSLRLFEACAAAGVQRILFSSTGGAIYGTPQQLPIPEDHPTEPWSPYGITKLTVEKFLAFYARRHGLAYTILRSANAYGPRQQPGSGQGVIATFMDRVQRGQGVEVWGDASTVRDYLYIEDLAAAFAAVTCRDSLPHALYNVGSGRGTSLSDLLDKLEALHGSPITRAVLPARGIDPPANVLDIRRLQADSGWQPRVALDEGLRRSWAWMQDLHHKGE